MMHVKRSSVRLLRLVLALAAGGIATGCVQDFDVEDEVLPTRGAVQPPGDGTETLDRAEACEAVTEAEDEARDRLDCDSADRPSCPEYLNAAGALPCDEINAGSVEACVDEIDAYTSCADFDRRPCIVTVITESCRPPVLTEAGADADAAFDASSEGAPPDATPVDGALADGPSEADDGAADGAPEASADATADAGDAGADAASLADGSSDASID